MFYYIQTLKLNMNIFLFLFLFYVMVKAAPVEENYKDVKNTDIKMGNETKEEARAGIIDTLNPFNNNNAPNSDNNKDNQQNRGPLNTIQNMFNISNNPFQQLFSSSSGNNGNFLNDVKIFLVGSQGMIFPASAIFGGFQNFIQALGNMGSFFQGAQNLLPSLPGR